MISDDVLESIRTRVDIVDLVRESVPQLQRAGRNFKARCPFHQERTPSFIVTPERQSFHCFGCGVGGDVFSFVMKMESLNFMEAAEKLAGRAGIEIVKKDQVLGPADAERLKLKELLELAAAFYHTTLLQSSTAAAARKYLAQRQVSDETITEFRLGYAPSAGDVAQRALRKGFSRDLVVKAGLAREAGTGLRDYFFDRVLYPIQDAKGSVVGFGARALGEAQPKYLNSPESPVFSKGRVLYGLFHGLATIRKERRVVLMEGYMDVMAAHQFGLKIACAPLGTALTLDQVALVKRYAGEAIVVFDADAAGRSAALRSAEILLAAGLEVRIAAVPQGKDPDEFLHAHGLPAFEECLASAVDLAEFQTELAIAARPGILTPVEKSAVARQVLETINRCPDEIVKAEWMRRLSQRLQITDESLRLQSAKRGQPARRGSPAPSAISRGELAGAEEDILVCVFMQPHLAELLQETDLASPIARRIWQTLSSQKPWTGNWALKLRDSLSPEENSAAQRILLKVDEFDKTDVEERLKSILARRRTQVRYEELRAALKSAGRLGAAEMGEYLKLTAQLKGSPKS